MGYESMFYSSKTVYVCGGNYLKFSKTNNCNGVRLPAFAIDGSMWYHSSIIPVWVYFLSGDYDDPVSIQSDYQCLQLHFWIVLYNKLCIFFQCNKVSKIGRAHV